MDRIYNQECLHSTLSYVPPATAPHGSRDSLGEYPSNRARKKKAFMNQSVHRSLYEDHWCAASPHTRRCLFASVLAIIANAQA